MKIKNIYKTYNTKTGEKVQALKGVSFDLPSTGMVAILGKSGSGKSTLLNVLSGLDSFDDGDIECFGKNMRNFSSKELDHYRNSCVGFVFQEYHLIPELTVGDNIAVALQLQGQSGTEEKVKDALKLVELVGYETRKIDELSGGQKQRVAIARALVKNPKIIFADEPTGALDSQTGESILQILKSVSKEKLVILVTHDREFAERFGDRIIELADGKVIADSDEFYQFADAEEQMKLKKPKIPTKAAMKIGCSSFKYHPIRLCSTVLLSVIAFLMLGVSLITSTVTYSDFLYDYLTSNDYTYSMLIKYNGEQQERFSSEDRATISEKFESDIFTLKFKEIMLDDYMESEVDISSVQPYMIASASESNLAYLKMEYNGDLPTSKTEVAITKALAEVISSVNNSTAHAENCLGTKLKMDGTEYTVTAVIDTGDDTGSELPLQNTLFVYDIDSFGDSTEIVFDSPAKLYISSGYPMDISRIIKDSESVRKYALSEESSGVYLPVSMIPSILYNISCNVEYTNTYYRSYGQLFDALVSEEAKTNDTQETYIKVFERIKNEFSLGEISSFALKNPSYSLDYSVKVNGFYFEDFPKIPSDELVMLGERFDEILAKVDSGSDVILAPIEPAMKEYLNKDAAIRAESSVLAELYEREGNISVFTDIAAVLSIIFAAFSALLLVSFISQSLSDKTKTVGILRAFGSDHFNVIKIFMWEGLVIGGAVFLVSASSLFGVCGILNSLFSGFIGFDVTFFSLNIIVVFELLVLSLVFSFIGCLIPIIKLIRMQPTDIIRTDI